ncbi:MAG: dephospho-CoA kinase, partial [Elusimicrobia bacterium CG11_big_fil_rev_8_21_14_0_20_64_6]
SLGAATLSLDQIAKEQAKPGREGYKAILRNFGPCILRGDGTINRALLGQVVFNDKRARRGLERATHPLILKEMKELLSRLKGLVVVDAPLLFEKKLRKNFDATILIACKPREQLKRIVRRDGLSPKDAALRIKAQMPLAAKRRLADVSIDNDKDIESLKTKIEEYHAGLNLLHRGMPNGNHN